MWGTQCVLFTLYKSYISEIRSRDQTVFKSYMVSFTIIWICKNFPLAISDAYLPFRVIVWRGLRGPAWAPHRGQRNERVKKPLRWRLCKPSTEYQKQRERNGSKARIFLSWPAGTSIRRLVFGRRLTAGRGKRCLFPAPHFVPMMRSLRYQGRLKMTAGRQRSALNPSHSMT